jgi:protein-glucosylgalactosylhydroxylysine glucosidase
MKKTIVLLSLFLLYVSVGHSQNDAGKIDRKSLVERHTVMINQLDSLASLSVGNGGFAFTVDVTGLQSFPDAYARGVPLGTESDWGWHSFPNVHHYQFKDALKTYQLNGRAVKYAVEWNHGPEKNKATANYFRQNPHRLQLGNIGFEIVKKDGSLASIQDIKNIRQTLNMWTGEIHSTFQVENIPVDVITYCHQQLDDISIKVKSILLKQGRLKIRIRLPYPTGGWADMGNNWNDENKHQSLIINKTNNSAIIEHKLDSTNYFINIKWKGNAVLKKKMAHYFLIEPNADSIFELSCLFTKKKSIASPPSFSATENNSIKQWRLFWQTGGAIDFSGSTDRRAFELERRIILSRYLTKIQCAGSNPPQETGLTYNSWYGKFHMEMFWWHAVHFALWGHVDLLEKSMSWYARAAANAKKIAERQGYDGVRWQKMTDDHGDEAPSSVGAFLIWQQPHFIYLAELVYRDKKDKRVLNKYKNLVFATADFMASFARFDSVKKKYVLGKGVIAAQERYKPEETYNPAYELVYWHWALETAQKWRKRLGLPTNKKWADVLEKLSPLPIQNDKYLFTESATDSYTNPEYRTDHPSVLAAYGVLPLTRMVDTTIMKNTFNWIWQNWNWPKTWGWDFPMTAMAATRLNMPEKAIDALLMNVQTNTYLPNGHNYQSPRLTIYLPGNGGLLTAIAMMCGGYDGNKKINPGIPKNGKWKVRTEGLHLMP